MKVLLITNQTVSRRTGGNKIIVSIFDSYKRSELFDLVSLRKFRVKDLLNYSSIVKDYDVVHVHFGGMYALATGVSIMFNKITKIITYHGTDIHGTVPHSASLLLKFKIKINRISSLFCYYFYNEKGFVSNSLRNLALPGRNNTFIDCLAVDTNIFGPKSMELCKERLNLNPSVKYLLFSSVSSNAVKRYDLAKNIIDFLPEDIQLLIMEGISFSQVPLYLNACHGVLLTSDNEGSPNVIREALSCGTPVFAFDVGDVREQLAGTKTSRVLSRKNLKWSANQILSSLETYAKEQVSVLDWGEYARVMYYRYKSFHENNSSKNN